VVEEGDFECVAGGEAAVAAMQVGVDEGELESFGSLGDDEGLAEVAEVGGVFAKNSLTVEDLAIATGISNSKFKILTEKPDILEAESMSPPRLRRWSLSH
jgi:hypothetical protein